MIDTTSLRSTLDELKRNGELLTTDTEINPENELAAIQKHFDGALPIMFNQVKGYPEAKIVTRFWIVGILLAVVTIVTLKIR